MFDFILPVLDPFKELYGVLYFKELSPPISDRQLAKVSFKIDQYSEIIAKFTGAVTRDSTERETSVVFLSPTCLEDKRDRINLHPSLCFGPGRKVLTALKVTPLQMV